MNSPDISVIIPTHNNGAELRRAILSITTQELLLTKGCSVEIIIVNDSSAQEYEAQLAQLLSDFPICQLLKTEKQSGPAAARNLGIATSKGSIIGFLDADDEWPADKLSLLLPCFDNPTIGVAGGKIKYLVEEGQPAINMVFEDGENRITHVHLGALLVRKSIFDQGLYFDETLTYSEDVDWWFRLREKHIGITIIEETTLLYHVHGNNMSVNKGIAELQLLKILHQSVQRRKSSELHSMIPQIKDFRTNQEDPLITIVMPLYNGKELIKKSLDSIIQQSYTNWELVVVDDGSTDGGAELIASNYPRARILRQENAGVAAARNSGIKHASGEIIAFLDQDDEWVSSKLREQWELLKENPYCSFVTCNQRFLCYEGVKLPANFSPQLLEEHRSLVPSALLIRKNALLHVNSFDESLEVSSDFDLIRRLRKADCKEANIDKLLLKKWYHGDNASQNKPVMRREILSLLHRQIKGQ